MDSAKNNYTCSGYSKRVTNCTAHYIRESLLDEIVLSALKHVTAYAREHTDDFVCPLCKHGAADFEKIN